MKKSENQVETLKSDIDECKEKIQLFNEKIKSNETLYKEVCEKISEVHVSI